MKSGRRLAVGALAVFVGFAHSAALAWACPLGSAERRGAPVEAAAASVAPCHGLAADDALASHEPASGNLCEVHCQTPTPQDGAGVAVPALVGQGWLSIPEPIAARAPGRADEPEEKGAAPPARALYCRRLN